MKDGRLEYYDALHQTVVFGRSLPSRLEFLDARDAIEPRQLIQTAEFTRLAFLRQAGLAWLVFPSATHTWFEHCIGSWGLARVAESLIHVRTAEMRRTWPLSFWLRSVGLREEFYLGLLCYQIGQGPLSQVLENNEEFVAALKSAGIKELNCRQRTAALLEGSGPLMEVWQQIAACRYGREVKTLREIGASIGSSLCLAAVGYIVSGNKNYFEKCRHPHKQYLESVADLVEGLIALRKLDHYGRDSYFSSPRRYCRDLRLFFGSVCMTPPTDASGTMTFSVLERDLQYAAGLLLRRRQSLLTSLRNPEIIALHEMASWALSTYIRYHDQPCRMEECKKIAFMEDDQLLEMITSLEHAGCRYMGRRIRGCNPYTYVGKWSNSDVQNHLSVLTHEFAWATKQSEVPPIILMHYQKEVDGNFPNSCFDPHNIRARETNVSLADHPNYRRNFEDLERAAVNQYLYVFVREEACKEELKSKINRELSKL